MSMATVNIKCDGIMCDSQQTFALERWLCRNDDIDYGGDSSYLFCGREECQQQAAWFDAQCPGCVAGFPECGLGRAYSYPDSKGLTPFQEQQVRSGVCPFRVNGTFSFSREAGFNQEHLDTPAPSGPGDAIVNAIRAYREKYGK